MATRDFGVINPANVTTDSYRVVMKMVFIVPGLWDKGLVESLIAVERNVTVMS